MLIRLAVFRWLLIFVEFTFSFVVPVFHKTTFLCVSASIQTDYFHIHKTKIMHSCLCHQCKTNIKDEIVYCRFVCSAPCVDLAVYLNINPRGGAEIRGALVTACCFGGML